MPSEQALYQRLTHSRDALVSPSVCPSVIHFDGLMQGRRNSSALTMELRLSCTNPSIWGLRRFLYKPPRHQTRATFVNLQQTAHHIDFKLSGCIHYGIPLAWLPFVMRCWIHELDSDLLSAVSTFPGKPLITMIPLASNLVEASIMGLILNGNFIRRNFPYWLG